MLRGITRRAFLRHTGTFAAMMALPTLNRSPEVARGAAAVLGTSLGMPESLEIVGRALTLVEVHAAPDPMSAVTARLMPDSLNPILGLSEDCWWYHVAEGYTPRELLQPITAYSPPPFSHYIGHYEVVSPVVAIREYCAGHARVLMRLPYGAVAFVHDQLVDDHGQAWYAVSGSPHANGLFGWAPAHHFREWHPAPQSVLTTPSIWIDTARYKLTVYDQDSFVGEAAFHGSPLLHGSGILVARAPCEWQEFPPGARCWVMTMHRDIGKPLLVYGAFWHNRFGTEGNFAALELPPFAAKWLYTMVDSVPYGDAAVIIE